MTSTDVLFYDFDRGLYYFMTSTEVMYYFMTSTECIVL